MEKRELVEQNITKIKEYVLEYISDIESTSIIVGNSGDDFDFAILLIADIEYYYCNIVENQIEYIGCDVDCEDFRFEGRIVYKYKNGSYNKQILIRNK